MSRRHLAVPCALALLCLAALASPALAAPPLFDGTSLPPHLLDLEQQRHLDLLTRSPAVTEARLILASPPVATDEAVTLTLFPGETVTVERQSVEVRGPRDYTWIGTVPGHATQAILVVHGDHLTGSVVDGDRTWAIRPVGGGVSAVLRTESALAQELDHPPGAYEALEARLGRSFKAGLATSIEKAGTCDYIDVVVAYTHDAASSVADIYGLAQLAVSETNQSYLNSNIAHQVRMVHFYGTDYNDSGDMTLDRNRFRDAGDGYMDEIHSLRSTYGGDVAMLITAPGNYCGIASAIYASSSTAFAVVASNCATGYYSFGHEIGHLYGARHNTQADPSTSPFSYGHGYYYQKGRTLWRTVMSYNCPRSCTRLPYWSNPNVTYGGQPMGTASTEHNARVLNETCSHLASFY